MEEIIGRLRSSSTSLSPPTDMEGEVATADFSALDHASTMKPKNANLESLPVEIITQIFAFLPCTDLAMLSRTSHLLRSHTINDLLWMLFVKDKVSNSDKVTTPAPAQSWKDLYTAHHPYWFLVRNKIWFGDNPNNGSLILTRYNQTSGCIEGFRVLAEHGAHTFDSWEHNPNVIIHTFNPKVRLWLEDPVIKLDLKSRVDGSRLKKEVTMQTGSQHGVRSMISLCQPIAKELQDPSMALWPPSIIPSMERVRNESPNKFRSEAHRPHSIAHMSEQTFRIRKWLEFSNLMQPLNSVRMGEDVTTFSTVLEESYKSTPEKPWQGIWVGDYSGHGCEFLLLVQREVTTNTRMSTQPSTGELPEGMSIAEMEAETTEQGLPSFQPSSSNDIIFQPDAIQFEHLETKSDHMPLSQIIDEEQASIGDEVTTAIGAPPVSSSHDSTVQGEKYVSNADESAFGPSMQEVPSGRLEAIKLTGDINVPRGHYTWLSEDIGSKGLIRIADEQMFKGARMVKAWGRIAGRGFRDDRFIPSQLIMISHDTLAQYWEDFGHISFYRRVNIDELVDA